MVCDMNINALSKYIILFLFTMLVVLSVLLGIEKASNNTLTKENARLTEMVELRDAAINEIDKNIASLQEQVLEAESICNERLKARENLLTFLSIEPTYNVGKNGAFFPQLPACAVSDSSLLGRETGSRRWETLPSEINLHNGSKAGAEDRTAPVLPKVISYEKSNIAIKSNNWAGNSKAVPRPNHPRFKGQVPQKCDSASLELNNKVISYEKSSYAINSINSYWVQFTLASDSKK